MKLLSVLCCCSLYSSVGPTLSDCSPGSSGSRSLSSWQKYAHVRQAQRGSKPYYTSATWWCGVVLMGVGELGNFAAYGFAPASLIAPLGCVSVIGKYNLFCFFSVMHYPSVKAKLTVEGVSMQGLCSFLLILLTVSCQPKTNYVLSSHFLLKIFSIDFI